MSVGNRTNGGSSQVNGRNAGIHLAEEIPVTTSPVDRRAPRSPTEKCAWLKWTLWSGFERIRRNMETSSFPDQNINHTSSCQDILSCTSAISSRATGYSIAHPSPSLRVFQYHTWTFSAQLHLRFLRLIARGTCLVASNSEHKKRPGLIYKWCVSSETKICSAEKGGSSQTWKSND
jgi:hypothetical protein